MNPSPRTNARTRSNVIESVDPWQVLHAHNYILIHRIGLLWHNVVIASHGVSNAGFRLNRGVVDIGHCGLLVGLICPSASARGISFVALDALPPREFGQLARPW